ncbi:hypothetical protein C8J56DRAFT_1160658 [Mycena floridula]|nr:hypothetical protein C8J56DRAFT_1160658 [Mycena floridula]
MQSGLEHKPSTKQLIHRYEVMDSPAKIALASPIKKEKLPVRQSFRNLLGILKKGQNKFRFDRRQSSAHLSLPQPDPEPKAELAQQPASQISGTLFYLSRLSQQNPMSSPLLPVWTSCTATLDGERITISWIYKFGNVDAHSISLSNCTDVRSITINQLEPEERALLPTDLDSEELRLFEILFESRTRERFATTTVRERANWVSAIWQVNFASQDVVIPSQRISSETPSFTRASSILSTPIDEKVFERCLPPIPPETPKPSLSIRTDVNLLHSRDSPNGSPLSRHSSKSPSIANLSHRSMVKQRLAQMEETQPSPTRPRLEKTRSARSYDADAIIDSYQLESPRRRGSPSATSTDRPPSSISGGIGPLIEFFQEQAAKQSDQITSLQRDIRKLPSNNNTQLLTKIQIAVSSVENRTQGNEATLKSVCAKVEEVAEHLRSNQAPMADNKEVIQSVQGVRDTLHSELNIIKNKLTELAETKTAPTTLHNLGKSNDGKAETAGEVTKELESRLESQMSEIVGLVQTDSEKRNVQMQQQADSVRYLNELNLWLEAFVNHGTSQIQVMSGSVDRLCTELGCGPAQERNPAGLAADIRDLAQEIKTREQSTAALQAAINNLAGSLNADASIANMIHRQQEEHEGLLRAVAGELSNEIRGERLRFVEAMKEATAINVQSHVEEFKKELKREVQGMTQEVGRLYRERQMMENQIAELFSFHSKHKKNPLATVTQLSQPPPMQAYSDGRGLPNPHSRMYKRA